MTRLFVCFLGLNFYSLLFAGDTIVFAENDMAKLGVEHAFYTSPKSEYYFLHFIIYNKSAKTIGADLSDPNEVVFLNQLEIHHDTNLICIHNELFNKYAEISGEEEQKLKADYAASKLKMIGPGKTLDYYSEFRGGEKISSEKLFSDTASLSLYLNGRLKLTDGSAVKIFLPGYSGEYLSDEAGYEDYFNRHLIFWAPATWKKVPYGALLIHKQ